MDRQKKEFVKDTSVEILKGLVANSGNVKVNQATKPVYVEAAIDIAETLYQALLDKGYL
jgi:hypothetical protein